MVLRNPIITVLIPSYNPIRVPEGLTAYMWGMAQLILSQPRNFILRDGGLEYRGLVSIGG